MSQEGEDAWQWSRAEGWQRVQVPAASTPPSLAAGLADRAVVPTGVATKIRIGPPKYGYIYEDQGTGFWKCVRGSEYAKGAEGDTLLWIQKEDTWIGAFDARPDASGTSPQEQRRLIFWTNDMEALSQGRHPWKMSQWGNAEGIWHPEEL